MSKSPNSPRFKRILLKLSGEVLGGTEGFGLHPETVKRYAEEISQVLKSGTQVAMVIGGGNFWRGRMAPDMDHNKADYMGMLATVMNAVAFAEALKKAGVPASVQSALVMPQVVDTFSSTKACELLDQGQVVIFSGGTGNPYFTTDSAAALRSLQINADALLKGTKVDGVYDSDPVKNPQARRFDNLSYTEVLQRGLQVMDAAAISLCKDNGMPIYVFDAVTPGNLVKAVSGEPIGTLVEEEKQ